MDGLVCPHCNKRIEVFGKGGAEKAAKDFGIPLLGSIPLTPSIADSGDDGVPFAGLDNGVATRFREMADRIVELTENGAGK